MSRSLLECTPGCKVITCVGVGGGGAVSICTTVCTVDASTTGSRLQELGVALRQALDALAPLDRDVFLMREAGGLGYDEIARACDITADAVRSRLHRARLQLRARLEPSLARTYRGVRLYDRHHESG